MSNRHEWAKLLPVIQAFVNGDPIQRQEYTGRWVDTDSIYQIRHTAHRIKPKDLRDGKWLADFEWTADRTQVKGKATLEWLGGDHDTPEWPGSGSGWKMIGEPRFVPNETP